MIDRDVFNKWLEISGINHHEITTKQRKIYETNFILERTRNTHNYIRSVINAKVSPEIETVVRTRDDICNLIRTEIDNTNLTYGMVSKVTEEISRQQIYHIKQNRQTGSFESLVNLLDALNLKVVICRK